MIWAPSYDSDQPGHQSDQSLCCPHEETLGSWLPTERAAKTPIRLGRCPDWSKSSLGTQVILLVLLCAGSNVSPGVSWRVIASPRCWATIGFPDIIIGYLQLYTEKLVKNIECRNDPKFLDRSWQTVLTQIRLLLIRFYTVCNSVCIFWTHLSTVKQSCSNFRVITAKFSL